jgi:hypothetical protein
MNRDAFKPKLAGKTQDGCDDLPAKAGVALGLSEFLARRRRCPVVLLDGPLPSQRGREAEFVICGKPDGDILHESIMVHPAHSWSAYSGRTEGEVSGGGAVPGVAKAVGLAAAVLPVDGASASSLAAGSATLSARWLNPRGVVAVSDRLTGCPVLSLSQIAAVSARTRDRTRAITPAGDLPPCRSRSSCPLKAWWIGSMTCRSGLSKRAPARSDHWPSCTDS